jgi:rod shape-determining protein MreB
MLFSSIHHWLFQEVGIDLGTANTVVMVRDLDQKVRMVARQPSYVARQKKTGEVFAIGTEAKRMAGKTPRGIEVVRPLRDGVIADFDGAAAMLEHYIGLVIQASPLKAFARPRVLIGIPSGVTDVERRAVRSAALASGAGEAYVIEEPMAAAIGAGLHVEEPEGRMIIDIGGGTTEIAVLSLGGIVVNRSIRIAGDEFDEAVVSFARMRHGLVIGDGTAEQTKIAIGSVYATDQSNDKKTTSFHVIRGRDLETGMPKSVKLQSAELREALASIAQQLLVGIQETLEETPPELVADIMKHGIVLAGGSSQLRGLEALISDETRMPVWTVPHPELAVANGCIAAFSRPRLMRNIRKHGS